ncbi:protein ABHD14B [Callorhinchus milii]|uniref:Putative protein-lysine deacylase ABHD14B n=1 Tax=Callorhinchus milii TaxID=7868 RepID=V9KT48_CALMI|nr:protein ABHD14B [Callorhinchus milii]XP_007888696.1 protein ABHD14B [Callorhinchus milii]|eukprot:gi/632946715/ref/XP_007888695.1/ PREDICTED: alpha/beta hydrolase domain-containing protein 14B [Callorhinchus milii]
MDEFPIKENSIEVSGKRLFIRLTAPKEQPPKLSVLLLHGIRFSSANWFTIKTLEVLADNGYHAVAIDLPGYGESKMTTTTDKVGELVPASFLKEVCEALHLEQVVLISPSMSGMYSLPFVFEYPSMVKAFIPVAPICTNMFTPEQYASLQVPSLIVYGDQDAQLGKQSFDSLKNLANHKVMVMKGAGHACYLDRPEEWNQALLKYLQSLV